MFVCSNEKLVKSFVNNKFRIFSFHFCDDFKMTVQIFSSLFLFSTATTVFYCKRGEKKLKLAGMVEWTVDGGARWMRESEKQKVFKRAKKVSVN